jgi:hypothetical protein
MSLRKKIQQTRPIQLNGYGFKRLFFENLGYGKAAAERLNFVKGPLCG